MAWNFSCISNNLNYNVDCNVLPSLKTSAEFFLNMNVLVYVGVLSVIIKKFVACWEYQFTEMTKGRSLTSC